MRDGDKIEDDFEGMEGFEGGDRGMMSETLGLGKWSGDGVGGLEYAWCESVVVVQG